MALSVLLRQSCRLQAPVLQSLVKTPLWKPTNTRNYMQMFNQANKLSPVLNTYKSSNLNVVKRNMSGDHSKLWPIERMVTLVLLGVLPATFIAPNPVFDNILAIAMVAHMHWGLEACAIDYIRPIIFGPVIPKAALGLLYLISALTLGGLLYFNYCDIGIGNAGRKLWEIQE